MTTQQEIESWLWEAANILRGPVDPANLRDFVFPLLFLKRLSDTWDEEQAKAVENFGKDIDVVCTKVQLHCLSDDLAATSMSGDSQHVELAQQHCIQTKGQHFALTHWNSMGGCITF